MKSILQLVCVLVPALGASAQEAPKPAETMSKLSSAASAQLDGSIRDLNALREQIAQEKVPLAEQLTAAEETLAQRRREHERLTRSVDESNLELSGLKAGIKARQDELAYIGNLLDEYARSFESKIGPCELQRCGEVVQKAKQAAENAALSMGERFELQLALVRTSVERLVDAVGGMRFPGVAVDLQGLVVQGQFALIGPVALFRADNGLAGLVVPQSGSTNSLVRPLEGEAQGGIGALVESGSGTLPLDPSRGGALKALVQKTNLIHIFEKGGPIMWPLLFASILALGTVLERFLFLARERRRRDRKSLDRLFAEVEVGNVHAAVSIAKSSRDFVVRTLGYALEHKEKSLSNALLYAQARELKRFRRGIPILDTVITLAPLLGLLGTVTGMMGSFALIGGELSAPGAITGGIAEALIATAFGLGIAITALLPFNVLNSRLEEATHEIESAATQLELLVHPQPKLEVAAVA